MYSTKDRRSELYIDAMGILRIGAFRVVCVVERWGYTSFATASE